MALNSYYLPLLATMALCLTSPSAVAQQGITPTMAPLQATTTIKHSNESLDQAIAEMKAASYYAFVMILELVGDRLPMNGLTFLMPSDENLSHIAATKVDLLMHHTIPRPLTFHDLLHFPTGSFIPSLLPNYMYSVANGGKRNFSLNNVKIVAPDLCNGSPNIQCHGISSVITDNTTSMPPPSSINPGPAPHYSSNHVPPPLPNNPHIPSPAMAPASLQQKSPLDNLTSIFSRAVQSPPRDYVGHIYAWILLVISVGYFLATSDVYWL